MVKVGFGVRVGGMLVGLDPALQPVQKIMPMATSKAVAAQRHHQVCTLFNVFIRQMYSPPLGLCAEL